MKNLFRDARCHRCVGRVAVCLVWLLLLCGGSYARDNSVASPNDSSIIYQFHRVESRVRTVNFFIVDLDGDGIKDLFRIFGDHRTYHANKFCRGRVLGPALYQGNSLYDISGVAMIDIDTVPGVEVALIKRDTPNDSLWVEIYKGSDKTLLCRTAAVSGKNISPLSEHWGGGASTCYAYDPDDDGRMEIILPVGVGHDLYPRGVYVYDYPSGRLKWWFPTAGSPNSLQIYDANGDGFGEIYIKTSVPCNGAEVDGRTDCTSYIHVIDHLGNLIWTRELGDKFDLQTGQPIICDCDGDGTTEIYYTRLYESEEFDQRIWGLQKHRAIDDFFIEQISFDADHEFHQVYKADFGGKNDIELILNETLCRIATDGFVLIGCGDHVNQGQIMALQDLPDEDVTPEIIYACRDSLVIFDRNMNLLGKIVNDNGAYFNKAEYFETPFGQNYLITNSNLTGVPEASTLDIYLVELRSDASIAKSLAIPWNMIIGIAIGIVLGGTVCYLAMKNRKPRERISPQTAQFDNLLTSLVDFNHGRMAGKNLDRLMFLSSNLHEDAGKLEEIKPNFKGAVDAFQSYTYSQMQTIASNAMKFDATRKTAQRVSDRADRLRQVFVDTPVTNLSIDTIGKLKAIVPKSVQAVKEDIKNIRTYVQSHFSANLLRVIPEVMSTMAGELHQRGVGFNRVTSLGGVGKLIFFSEQALASIFQELVSNACDAMEKSDTKEMTLDVVFRAGEVAIKLSDTGPGFDTTDEDQIFSRTYSTHGENRGYGLYHARQQIERFGGGIRAYNNESGTGATVELILKTLNHE